jgi:hypothetical protein
MHISQPGFYIHLLFNFTGFVSTLIPNIKVLNFMG